MPSRNIADCTEFLQEAWKGASEKWNSENPNAQVFLTCTHRTNEEQAELYALGRTKKGKIVTYNKAGTSKHNKKPSEAFDIAFKDKKGKLDWNVTNFKKFAQLAKTMFPKLKWGGDFKRFKDNPHFEQ